MKRSVIFTDGLDPDTLLVLRYQDISDLLRSPIVSHVPPQSICYIYVSHTCNIHATRVPNSYICHNDSKTGKLHLQV